MSEDRYRSFGRTVPGGARALLAAEGIALLKRGAVSRDSLLPFGNGRTYGDSCQNRDGALIDMRPLNRVLSFNAETGLMVAEAGVLLSDVIAHAAPHGFFPPVVPGTQFVTLGGAIANDVHGKNHHRRGSFGCHVESFDLLRSDGQVLHCSPAENTRLYWATIGGMGLTGVSLSASLRLMRVPSLDIAETIRPFESIDEYLDEAEAADIGNEYAVAWIDQLARGRRNGRGLLLTGNHAEHGAHYAAPPSRKLRVPFQPPLTVLNRPFLKAFNFMYRSSRSRASGSVATSYQKFFFPLDAVGDWNRLYGPRGLYQHQSVIPFEAARETLPKLLEKGRQAGHGSFLTVLKRFGAIRSPALLSFPRPGYTLTLDFPNKGEATLRLLRELDAITVDAGGAVNPYKDARMSAAVFSASFPEWQRLEMMRDPAFQSDFWLRTAMQLLPHHREILRAAE